MSNVRHRMKLSLPLKLGIFVVLLFAAVTATCLLWTPVKIRYYLGKLRSENPKERVAGVDGLIGIGRKGVEALEGVLGGKLEAEFLTENWQYYNTAIPNDGCGYFPLHIAAACDWRNVAQLLIDRGADASVKDSFGFTPLYHAVEDSCMNVATLLLEKGADVNARENGNLTPLHRAAVYGHKDIIVFLLEKGAEINAKDKWGKTPLDNVHNKKRAALLRSYGAKTGEELRIESSIKSQGSSVKEKKK